MYDNTTVALSLEVGGYDANDSVVLFAVIMVMD